ncbi:hypothetical protein [Actinophytocola sp. KF-1]
MVRRIFTEYLAGLGDRAIANGLNRTASRARRHGGRSRTRTGSPTVGKAAHLRTVDQAEDLEPARSPPQR